MGSRTTERAHNFTGRLGEVQRRPSLAETRPAPGQAARPGATAEGETRQLTARGSSEHGRGLRAPCAHPTRPPQGQLQRATDDGYAFGIVASCGFALGGATRERTVVMVRLRNTPNDLSGQRWEGVGSCLASSPETLSEKLALGARRRGMQCMVHDPSKPWSCLSPWAMTWNDPSRPLDPVFPGGFKHGPQMGTSGKEPNDRFLLSAIASSSTDGPQGVSNRCSPSQVCVFAETRAPRCIFFSPCILDAVMSGETRHLAKSISKIEYRGALRTKVLAEPLVYALHVEEKGGNRHDVSRCPASTNAANLCIALGPPCSVLRLGRLTHPQCLGEDSSAE